MDTVEEINAWKLQKAEDHLFQAHQLAHNARVVLKRGDNNEYVKDNIGMADAHVRMATIQLNGLMEWE